MRDKRIKERIEELKGQRDEMMELLEERRSLVASMYNVEPVDLGKVRGRNISKKDEATLDFILGMAREAERVDAQIKMIERIY